MKPQANECDPARLELFLSGNLNEVEESRLAEHLDCCSSCCELLEQQAADPASWLEAKQLLQPTSHDGVSFATGTSTDGSKLFGSQPLQIQGVLDALTPTDDPEMLGRLGSYEISGVVGAGAMGVVLKGTDPSLDRIVAIKVLAPHLASSGAARKRFAREAKAAAAVLHHNVIAIHSVSNEQALPYLVMPYVRGASLQNRLNHEGSLQTDEILRIGYQIAAGLSAAHAQGLVHRDIKPANILLEEGVERVAITDFGLARAVDDASLTRTGVIAGTPQYMSPEQSRGETLDQRSDLFSLGSVMYAMCVGRPPFRADTTYGVIQRINNDQPTDIRELHASVPDWLVAIIAKLMSKQADDRFDSAEQVSELLEECLAHFQQPTMVPLPTNLIPKLATPRWSEILRSKLSIAALVAMAMLGVFAMIVWPTADPSKLLGDGPSNAQGIVDVDPMKPGQMLLHYCTADGTPIRPLLADIELRHRLNRQGGANVSADGRRVAFDAWPATNAKWQDGQIVVVDIDGNNAKVISDGFMPSFSPDGSQLAISRVREFGREEGATGESIWIINSDGSGKRLVADQGAWGARWSGDGKSLLFFKGIDSLGNEVPANCLRLYDLKTQRISNVFDPEDSPFTRLRYRFDWAKGERRLVAFAGDLKENGQRVSATIDVDEGLDSLKLLADQHASDGMSFSWHPNGKLLLVTGKIADRLLPVHIAVSKNTFTTGFPGLPNHVGAFDSTYTPDGEHIIMSFLASPDRHESGEPASLRHSNKQPDSAGAIPEWATKSAAKLNTVEEVEAKLTDHIHLSPHNPFTRALMLRKKKLSEPVKHLAP